MASLISLRSLAPSLPLFFFLFSISHAIDGRDIYFKNCSSCHHEKRIGRTAPPLLPEFLKRKSDNYLKKVIKDGIPATTMPSFESLSDEEVDSLISFLRKPAGRIEYSLRDVKESYQKFGGKGKILKIKDLKNLTVFVDKGGKVYLLEGEGILDSFPFKNVHGGVKFSPDGSRFYVPSRDGWVLLYDLEKGKPSAKVRTCIYLRNIALSRDGSVLAVACTLPKTLVLLDKDLRPLKSVDLPGRPSAVYELHGKGLFLMTFRDKPYMAFIEPSGRIRLSRTEEPLEDFFIDPFENYVVGSSRGSSKLVVYSLETGEKVFEQRIEAMPHLFSSSFWYGDGNFYFATRHVGSEEVSIWRMYDWKFIRSVDVGGRGFFVRTHPDNPYLWIDNRDKGVALLNKKTFEVKRITVSGKVTHVEFSGDGRLAYLSVLEGDRGSLLILDPLTFRKISLIPSEQPAGKYNFVLKSRKFLPLLLGKEVFMAKCWGCHHLTEEAFGPSFKWIVGHRSKEEIVSQILNPEETAKLLGYKRNAMPRIEISRRELEAILSLMESLKEEEKLYAEGE